MWYHSVLRLILVTCFIHDVAATLPSDDAICGLANSQAPRPPPASRFFRHTRMVNGQDALPNEFPWQVGLKHPGDREFFCGGTIIHSRWVITSAHCMVDAEASNLLVVVGEHDQRNDRDRASTVGVKKILVNPNYNHCTFAHDFALLKLVRPLTWSREVKPVCLPKENTNLYEAVTATVSGWGLKSEFTLLDLLLGRGHGTPPDKIGTSDVLQKVTTLKVWEVQKCYEYNPYTFTLTDICAYDEGKDSCKGDSGGPLVTQEGSGDGRYTLIGVVSSGSGCARVGHPTKYARVTSALGWIDYIVIQGKKPKQKQGKLVALQCTLSVS